MNEETPASQLKLGCSKYKQFNSACLLGALVRQFFEIAYET